MRTDLSRSSALVASLLALLPPRPASSFLASLAPGGTHALDPLRAFDTTLFPYPVSLKVLDVLDGAIPLPAGPVRGDGVPAGATVVAFPAGVKVLDRILEASAVERAVVERIQALALAAWSRSLAPEERARLEASYLAELARLAELADTLVFDGIPLISGSPDVCLVLPPPASGYLPVRLPDWSPRALHFWPTMADAVEAEYNYGQAYGALEWIALGTARLVDDREVLLAGGRSGGLREVERLLLRMRALAAEASDGTMNTTERVVLDAYRRSDLQRLELVAEATRFDGTLLLGGGQLWLQGALGTMLLFDLPDADAAALGVSGSCLGMTTLTSAQAMFEELGDALLGVRAERERVHETRAALANVVLRFR